jgi:hypothetical protein
LNDSNSNINNNKKEKNTSASHEDPSDNYWNRSFSLAVMRRLLRTLNDHSPGINRTTLAGKTGLNYGTCIRYLDLLLLLQWIDISPTRKDLIFLTHTGGEFMVLLEQARTMSLKRPRRKYSDPINVSLGTHSLLARYENASILEMHRLSGKRTQVTVSSLQYSRQTN